MSLSIHKILLHILSASLLCYSFLSSSGEEPRDALSPAESLRKIQLADPDLTVELIVSEPQIDSPVAITWDADGAMYVVQMSDYPTAETGGSIRRLVDADRDGTFEKVTTFASNLKFPSGALAWNAGLLVTAAPDILFFQDRDGDGIAEHREVLFTGFIEGNQQLRVNGLTWGLDNLVYGANGRSDGEITSLRAPDSPPVPLRRHDFRFSPVTGSFEPLAGFSQFGLGRDDFNHRFLSWNTLPFRQAVIEEADLNCNPHLTIGESIALIAEPGDTGRIFPISSPPKTFNRERTDYFNASCGLMIFRGQGLGEKYRGNAFVAEPLTNLVHRKILEQQGPLFIAKRGEQNQEFFASKDNWTHPVYPAMGPDGCLYLADFYREWVEHPQFVQEALRQGVDFRVGNQHGRIWRIRRNDFTPTMPTSLREKTSAELVELLDQKNAWLRETAQRLLVERQTTDVTDALIQLARTAAHPVTRVQALWTLQGLNRLPMELLKSSLTDPSPAIRCQGIQLIRRFYRDDQDLYRQLLSLLNDDPDQEVRFQVALAAGDHVSVESRLTLARIAARDADSEWMRLAILSGLGDYPEQFLDAFQQVAPTHFHQPFPGVRNLLREVITLIATGGEHHQPGIAHLVHLIAQTATQDESTALTLLSGLGEGLARTPTPLDLALKSPPAGWESSASSLNTLVASTPRRILDASSDDALRLLAWQVLLRGDPPAAARLLPELLAPTQPPDLQTAAARGLGDLADPELAKTLLESWSGYSLNARRELLTALARRQELVPILLDSIAAEQILPREVDFTTREALARHPNPQLHERTQQLLSNNANSNRQAIIEKYATTPNSPGNSQRGAELFAQQCAVCHQMRGEGARVGPDLSGIASRPKPAILVDLFDPGREVSPDFVNYVILTKQGQVFMGLLAAETPGGVRLKRQQGAEDFIPRADIEELRVNAKSLMPEGFEERFSQQDVSDLLEFLHHPLPLPK